MNALTVEVVDQFGRLSTATISDAMDTLGLPAGCHGIRPMIAARSFVGLAHTILYAPARAGQKSPAPNYLNDIAAGSVVVIDNGGRTECTAWGDLLSLAALQRGIAATVIDGACRDVDAIEAIGYPVFAKAAFMMSGKNRNQMVAAQVPVTIGEREVTPGDILRGDGSGVVAVPSARAREVLDIALRIEEVEGYIRDDVSRGGSLAESRKRHGYNAFGWRGEPR